MNSSIFYLNVCVCVFVWWQNINHTRKCSIEHNKIHHKSILVDIYWTAKYIKRALLIGMNLFEAPVKLILHLRNDKRAKLNEIESMFLPILPGAMMKSNKNQLSINFECSQFHSTGCLYSSHIKYLLNNIVLCPVFCVCLQNCNRWLLNLWTIILIQDWKCHSDEITTKTE